MSGQEAQQVEETQAEAASVEEAIVEETSESTTAEADASTEGVALEAEAPTAPATDKPKGKKKRWYIIHAYSGYEKKVAENIKETAAQQGLSDAFEAVEVPSEEVVQMRRGKKVTAERKFFPGYVLAKMEMTDASWQLVCSTDKVSGFLGGGGSKPQPITQAEADAIFQQVQEGIDTPKNTIIYEIGEQVKVIDGPFDSFVGTVEDVDEDKEKLKVSVSIFGRPTPVELDYSQVDKVS